ncbi:MAG: hypothetical protein DYG89_20145 [Caldilinea sp. CFX5]|nr:hypothetical protein [Caldilinea sp. CFX5]
MDLYTHPIRLAEPTLLELAKRTQTTQAPIKVTVEGMSESALVLMKLDAYEKNQQQQQRLYQRLYQLQLLQLKQWLDRVEEQWDERSLRTEFVATWQENITQLWEVCPEPSRGLCASLMLAIKRLDAGRLSLSQIAALRYCLTLLQSVIPSDAEVDHAYRLLSQSGLPPKVSFDQSFVQSYLDEL